MATARRTRLVKEPFQIDGAPEPSSLAFASELYESTPTAWTRSGVVDFQPKVIAAPGMSGKSAHANWIEALQEQISQADGKSVFQCHRIGPTKASEAVKWTPTVYAREMSRKLGSADDSSLVSLIESAQGHSKSCRTVVIIDIADFVNDDVIQWMLSNVKRLANNPELVSDAQIQVLLAGSFTLDTLTGGQNSPYPMPFDEIPEFDRKSQSRFVLTRMRAVGIEATDRALAAMWTHTQGDKFLTQMLCVFAREERERDGSKRPRLTKTHVDRARDRFLSVRGRGRSPRFFDGLAKVCDAINVQGRDSDIVAFLNREREWEDVPWEDRRLLFKCGLIAREKPGSYGPRAPLVQEAIESRIRRGKSVVRFTKSWLKFAYVQDSKPGGLDERVEELTRSAVRNHLIRLYIGAGEVIGENLVLASMESLDGDTFDVEWEVTLPDDISIGEQVVLESFTYLNDADEEITKVRVGKAKR